MTSRQPLPHLMAALREVGIDPDTVMEDGLSTSGYTTSIPQTGLGVWHPWPDAGTRDFIFAAMIKDQIEGK